MKGYFGGEKGGVPLVLWRDDEEYPSDVVVLSPFGNYMTSRLCPVFDYGREKERRENEGRGEEEEEEEEDFVTKVYENFQSLYCGLAGTISDVPSEYSLVIFFFLFVFFFFLFVLFSFLLFIFPIFFFSHLYCIMETKE